MYAANSEQGAAVLAGMFAAAAVYGTAKKNTTGSQGRLAVCIAQ
jgi:hypothetical protein